MQLAELSIERHDHVLVATLVGEVDMSNAADLTRALTAALVNEDHGLVVDLAAVTYLDSAGIHMLFELRERLTHRAQQLHLVLDQRTPSLDALTIMGVQAAVPTWPSVAAALSAMDDAPAARDSDRRRAHQGGSDDDGDLARERDVHGGG